MSGIKVQYLDPELLLKAAQENRVPDIVSMGGASFLVCGINMQPKQIINFASNVSHLERKTATCHIFLILSKLLKYSVSREALLR